MRLPSTLLVVVCTITSIFVGDSSGTSPELKTIIHVNAGIQLENIAVRSNGQLLLSALGSAALYQFNPIADTKASVIATFPYINCVFGIAEISPDVFAVAVGNYSRSTSAIPGSFGVWAVNLREREPVVSKVADLPYARYLNGMTAIPPADGWKTNATILLTDTILGKFYHVDPTTFQSATVLSSNATGAEAAAQQPGLNGIRYIAKTGKLYYTNTIAEVYGYIHLSVDHSAGGGLPFIEATGPFEVITSSLPGDDFVVLPDGTAYISGNPVNTVFKVTPGGDVSVFLGGANATTTPGPTSAALGRTALDRNTLYITSSGIQPNATVSEGGKLWAVSLSDTKFSSPGCPAGIIETCCI